MKKLINVMTWVVLVSVMVMELAWIAELVTDYMAYQEALAVKEDLEALLGHPVKFTVVEK